MEVIQLYWWEHSSKSGQYSSAKVHGSLQVALKDGVKKPQSVDDYAFSIKALEGIKPDVLTY
jgi:CRISPR-associated protein Csd2